jgi:hypothetical protein
MSATGRTRSFDRDHQSFFERLLVATSRPPVARNRLPLFTQLRTFWTELGKTAFDPKPKWVSICVKLTGATYLLNKLIGSVVAENIRVSGQMHRVNQAGQLTARNTHQHRIYSCTNRSRFHMSTYSQIDELLRPLLDSSVAATGNADFFAYANRIMPDHC